MTSHVKGQEISAVQSIAGLVSALTKSKPRLFSPTATKVRFQTVRLSEDEDDNGNTETDVVLQDRDFDDSFNVCKQFLSAKWCLLLTLPRNMPSFPGPRLCMYGPWIISHSYL